MKYCYFLLAAAVLSADEPPNAIYYNGKVTTLAARTPRAQAFAVRANRFVAVGSDTEIRKLAGPRTRLVDLQGRGVLPGLIDSHTHPIGAALSEKDEPLPDVSSIAEVQAWIRDKAKQAPADRTIYLPKIYSTRLKDRRYPTRQELDQAAPGRVVLMDTGYNAVLSSAALAKMGIGRDTPKPKNGRIIRDASGEPTGLILGAAQLWSRLRPATSETDADRERALKTMQKLFNAVGITSTIDRGVGPDRFRVYQQLWRRGELTVRTTLTYMIPGSLEKARLREHIENIPFITGFGDEWMKVGALKVVADGGILLGTAYMREPYGVHTEVYGYQDPDYRGELAVPAENLTEIAKTANRLGWQMTAHTTGGAATDLLLDAYEAADREHSIRDKRFTVTHGNFPDQRAIDRARKLGVAFDVQPAWHHLDGPALRRVLGPERTKWFLPFRSMLDAGLVVAGGSDHMVRLDSRRAVNPYNPFFGMWMAITRKTADGATLNPEQAVTREEALKMWTGNGAWMAFEENKKGSIEPGKLADFVVTSEDYSTCAVERIKDIEALTTVVDGNVVFEASRR